MVLPYSCPSYDYNYNLQVIGILLSFLLWTQIVFIVHNVSHIKEDEMLLQRECLLPVRFKIVATTHIIKYGILVASSLNIVREEIWDSVY